MKVKKTKEECGALIVKPGGETVDIYFLCANCRRISIFTNDFSKKYPAYHGMSCSECGHQNFEVLSDKGF
jgi:DNA-directed RNA polymerase subunit RPC12/RpoP